MCAQNQKGIPPAFSNNPTDDHESCIVSKKKNTIIAFFAYCHYRK